MLSFIDRAAVRVDLRRRTSSRLPHVHHFRYHGEDPFSPNNLYRCRCGLVRHGL